MLKNLLKTLFPKAGMINLLIVALLLFLMILVDGKKAEASEDNFFESCYNNGKRVVCILGGSDE